MAREKITTTALPTLHAAAERYAAARRRRSARYQEPPRENRRQDALWFAIRYRPTGMARITARLDHLFGGGPGRSGVAVDADEIRVQMAEFRQVISRSSVRTVRRHRSRNRVGGTTGVHVSRGRLLVNGSTAPDDLVEVTLDPPCDTGRYLATSYLRQRVDLLIVSLVDPDGFIAALSDGARTSP